MKNFRSPSTIFFVIGILFFAATLLLDIWWQYRDHNNIMQKQGIVLQRFIDSLSITPPDIFDLNAAPSDSGSYSFTVTTDPHSRFRLPEGTHYIEKIKECINSSIPGDVPFFYVTIPFPTEYIFLRVIRESVDDSSRNHYRCSGIIIPYNPHSLPIHAIIESEDAVVEFQVASDDLKIPWCIIAFQQHAISSDDALWDGIASLMAQRIEIKTPPVSFAGFDYRIFIVSKKGILSYINLSDLFIMIVGCSLTYLVSRQIGRRDQMLFTLRDTQQHRDEIIKTNGVYAWEYDTEKHQYVFLDKLKSKANHADWRNAIDSQDRENVLGLFNNCVKGNTGEYTAVYRYTGSENTILWIREQGRVTVRGANGLPLKVAGILLDITASVETNDTLAGEINFRRDIEHSISYGIICLDLNKVHTYVNTSFLVMFGYTKEEIIGSVFPHQYIPEQTAEKLKATFSALFAGTTDTSTYEFILKRRNGERFSAMVSLSRMFDQMEQHNGWMVNIIDLTESKKNKQLTADIHNKYKMLFESIPIGIVHQDEQGNVVESNTAAKEMLLFPQQNIIASLTHKASLTGRIRRIRENGTECTQDDLPSAIALRTRDKVENVIIGFQDDLLQETAWMNISAFPNGSGGGIYTIFQNVTTIRKYQIQTEKSEREFRALAQNASVGIFRVNKHLQYLFVNDALLSIGDFDSLEQFIERGGLGSLVHKKETIFGTFRKMLVHGSLKDYKVCIRSNKGVEKWLLLSATFVEDKIYGTLVDITANELLQKQLEQERDVLSKRIQERTVELTQLNEQLRATSDIKDDFLSTVSHELRTPFNSILTLTEALTEGIYGPLTANQLNKLKLIIQSGRHLLTLINDLLDLSKINAGKFELEYSSMNLHELVGMAFTMISEDINNKNLNIKFKNDSEPVIIVADERRMRQIIINLLSNAIKFTKEKGTIGADIHVDEEKKLVTLNIWDTGIGIQRDKIKKLFTTFSQIDSSLSRNYQGTGLGLALVKKLTELQGGTVSVQSVYGAGSTFSVTIPQQRHAASAVVSSAAPIVSVKPSAAEIKKKLILVVDDNKVTALNIKDYLDIYGYKTNVAFSGKDAIKKATENPPDVMLVDIQMPGMDGIELIQKIRATPIIQQAKIIGITATTMPGDRERCLWAGADDHAGKETELKKLMLLIDRYAGH